MKRLALLALLAVTASMTAVVAAEVGAWLLVEPPDARTVALASAGVALDSLEANTFYNPAAISHGPRFAATWTHRNMSPEWFHGMSYDHAGLAARFGDRLGVAANLQYAQYGETEVINEHGRLLGRYRPYDVAPSASFAYHMAAGLSAGVTAKAFYSSLVPDWVWDSMPELGIVSSGTAFTVAADAGVQYRPLNALTLGFAVANLGPNFSYDTTASSMLPRLARLGIAVRPRIPGPVSAMLTSEVSRDLWPEVAKFAWHAGAGLEIGVCNMAFFRLGYYHHDRIERGPTWGVGLERHGIRLDLGVDSGFNGEPGTRDVRFELSAGY